MAKQDLHFSITASNEDLKRKLAESRQAILDSGKTAEAQASRMDGAYKRMIGSVASIGGGIAIAALGRELYNFANAFDKSMLEVSTISDTVTENIDQFKQKVLELTTQIPISADVAGKALYQIVSAGYDGAAGMQLLEVSAKSAIAGMTDTTTAADAITTLLNAYKLSADDAANISDQLFMTAKLGKTTFGELGQSISQAAPIAASFGIETEQVLAAVATLTKSGTPTAQAMTQIRAAIIGASKELGDGYFKIHTFQEGLAEIAQRANGSEAELRKLMPEIEGMNGVLGLTGLNAKMAASDLVALGGATGETEKAFAKMNNQADAQLTILKNNALKKFYEIGDGAVDVMGSIAKFLNSDGIFSDTALDDLISTLVVLITTMGAYKASAIAVNAIQRVNVSAQYAAEIAELQKLLPAKQASANADIAAAVAKGHLSQATAEQLVSIRAEVQAELESLRVKAQTAQADMLSALEADRAAKERVENAVALVAEKKQDLLWSNQMGDARKIETAEQALNNATLKERVAISASRSTAAQLERTQINASAAATAVDTMQTGLNTAASNGATTAKNLFSAATMRLTKAFSSLKVAFATNPIGMIITGVTMAISLFSMFGNKVNKTKDLTGQLNAELTVENSKIDILFNRYENAAKGTKEYESAKKAIFDNYGQYLQGLNKEISTLKDVKGAYNAIKTAARESLIERLRASKMDEAGATASEGFSNAYDKILSDLKNRLKDGKKELANTIMPIIREALEAENTSAESDITAAYHRVLLSLKKTFGNEGGRKLFNGISGGLKDWLETSTQWKSELSDIDAKLAPIATKINSDQSSDVTDTSSQPSPVNKIKNYSNTLAEAMLETERMKIDLMQEGRAKELAEIEQTKNEKIVAIEKEQAEIAAVLQKGGLSKDKKADLTKQNTELNSKKGYVTQQAQQDTAAVDKKYDGEIAERERAITDIMLSEEQQRIEAIKRRYDKEREWAKEQLDTGGMTNNEYTKFNAAVNAAQTEETQQELQTQLKNYENFVNEYLSKADQFNSNIKDMTANGASTKDIDNTAKVQGDILIQMEDELKAKSETFAAFASQIVNVELDELYRMLETAQTALDAAKDNGSSGESVEQLKSQIAILQQRILALTADKSKKVTGDPTKKWKDTLGIMNDVKQLTSDVIGNFDGLDETTKIILDSAMNVATGVINMIIGIVTLTTGSAVAVTSTSQVASASMQAMEKASVILAIIGAALQIAMAIAKALAAVFNDDGKKEEEIQRLQGEVDALEKSYEALEKAIDNAYSISAASLIDEQNTMLEKQKALIRLQIATEESKKDSDGSKIEDWKKQIEELDSTIEENKEKAIDAIFGADLKSAIDDFASAYVDAWSAGEDRAQAQKDVVKDMIRGIVAEIVKSNIAGKVADLRTALKDAIIDGVIDETEQAAIDKLQEEIYAQSEKDAKAYDKWLKEDDTAKNEDSLVGQIKGSVATEASVAELGGFFKSQTDSLLRIDSKLDIGFGRMLEIARSNAAIEANTAMTAINTAQTVATLAGGFASMQSELVAINKNTSKDGGSYGN